MTRPKRERRIKLSLRSNYFKPAGIPLRNLQIVQLSFEEIEAIRLNDFLGKDQRDAALEMGISQPTFHRILHEGRKKIAEALVQGKGIKIEGGNYIMEEKNIDDLKIAISAFSPTLEGEIDSRFGRCAYFLIITLSKGQIKLEKAIENTQSEMRGGVGVAIAEMLANENVDIVITKNIGPHAFEILKQFQIAVYQFDGSIKEAIKNFIDKKLNPYKG